MTEAQQQPEVAGGLTDEQLLSYAKRIGDDAMIRAVEVENLRWEKFELLSGGFVTLVDAFGSDAAIVQAARVSYGSGTTHVSADDALVRYLYRHRHTTPFEMAEIKLMVRVPMDCWRQWIRHRTASVNEYSTRYSVAIDDADTTNPDAWRLQSGRNKQGSEGLVTEWPDGYTVEEQPDGYLVKHPDRDDFFCHDATTPGAYLTAREQATQNVSRELYEERVDQFGVAREQARKDLPLSTYTLAYWKIDLHNLLHFLGLRMDSHAQLEIRQFATTIGEQIVKPLFPAVWSAFERYRLNATFMSGPCKQVLDELLKLSRILNLHPPHAAMTFEKAVEKIFPEWLSIDTESGKLKPHREREEVRSALAGLGLLATE